MSDRSRFRLALAGYAIWVLVLVGLIVVEGQLPSRSAAPEPTSPARG